MRSIRVHLPLALLSGTLVFCVLYVAAWYNLRGVRNVCQRQSTTRDAIRSYVHAIEEYQSEKGRFPEALTDLEQHHWMVDANGHPLDAWERPLKYTVSKDDYELSSPGRDGRSGGVGLDADLYHDERNRELSLPTFRQYLTARDPQEIASGGFAFAGLFAGVLVACAVFGTLRDLDNGEQPMDMVPLIFGVVVMVALSCVVGVFLLPVHIPSGH